MYIDLVPNRNSPPAVLLRESYRQDGKVKKRTLANLSKLPQELIARLRLALTGPVASLTDAVSGPIFGVLFVLNAVARSCGLPRALGSSRMATLTLFLVLARLAHQGSRLSAVRWASDHAVKAVLGLNHFDEDDLYAALDWVASQQGRIEQHLYQDYVRRVGQTPTLVLYDVTFSYLEGEQNALGAFGYNRDGKKGKQQIVIGLLTAKDGEPLSIEVFHGNTTDPETFGAQVDKLTQRFGIHEVVMVGDRGMIKATGKAALPARFRYITALTDPQVRKLIKHDVLQADLFHEQVAEVAYQGKRLILRRDPATYRKEHHRREDKLQRLCALIDQRNAFVAGSSRAKPEAGLRKLQHWARQHKLSAFVELTLQERTLALHVNTQAKRDAALLDGCYCIESDVPLSQLSQQEVHDRYKDLQHMERNFRRLKSVFLEVRPIYVRTAQRTRGHVFIAMLSLKVLRLLEQRLREVFGTTQENPAAETVQSALLALSRLCLQRYRVDDHDLVALPRPDPRQEKILAALNVKLTPPSPTLM
jgi:transposase